MPRVVISLSEDVANALLSMPRNKDKTLTMIVRDALSTELYLQNAIHNGETVLLESKQGKVRKLTFT